MSLAPGARKALLTVHITCSVGWVGAVLMYLALGVWAASATDSETLGAAWRTMALTGWTVIVPLAIGSLLTGLLVAVGSPWGLLRHYWVVVALVVTLGCVVVLLLHMPSVSDLAAQARTGSEAAADPALRQGDLPHPSIGLLLLLFVTALNVYKPRGLTGWGQVRAGRRRPVAADPNRPRQDHRHNRPGQGDGPGIQ